MPHPNPLLDESIITHHTGHNCLGDVLNYWPLHRYVKAGPGCNAWRGLGCPQIYFLSKSQ